VEQKEDVLAGRRIAHVEGLHTGPGLFHQRASVGSTASAASRKSVSKPNSTLSSRLARKRTSSASSSASTFAGLVNMVGTTTSVRGAGMPAEKSIRGRFCGATSSVASQFVSATALARHRQDQQAQGSSVQPGRPARGLDQQRPAQQRGDQADGTQIEEQRASTCRPADVFGQAGLGPGRLLQLRQAGVRQVIADVGGPAASAAAAEARSSAWRATFCSLKRLLRAIASTAWR
jgi:hypothetical protein